jgi:hypothetical protein
MGELVTDEILEAFAVVAEPEQVVAGIRQRLGGLVDRVSVTFAPGGKKTAQQRIAELRAA